MVTDEVRQQQIAYDRFHNAVAVYLGINRTDLRCLDMLDLAGRDRRRARRADGDPPER